MNYFDKNKILTVAVVLLLIINIGILAFLWIDRVPKSPEKLPPVDRLHAPDGRPLVRPPGNPGPKEFLMRELNFNEQQRKEYEKLVDEHKNDMKNIRDKIRNNKEKLWDLFLKHDVDSNDAEAIATEIGAGQKETEMVTFRHFQKVKDLCNDEQKEKFDKVIGDALKMMGPEVPPDPPPSLN